MWICYQKGNFSLNIYEVLTQAPSLLCPMSSLINRYKTWLNTAVGNKDVLVASQHIN